MTALGAEGRRFESCLPDHKSTTYARSAPQKCEQSGNDRNDTARVGAIGHGIIPECSGEMFDERSRERFWVKVEKTDSCWLWKAARQSLGYGHINIRGKMILAHRMAYAISTGPIPAGMTLDHLCRNRSCVNPDHLEVVSFAENVRRSGNPPAVNGRKTHCARGHAFDEANTGTDRGRYRYCKKCRALTSARPTHLTNDKAIS